MKRTYYYGALLTVVVILLMPVRGNGADISDRLAYYVTQRPTLESKVQYLASVVSEKEDGSDAAKNRKASALTVLGMLGGTNAINILVTNVAFRASSNTPPPAVQALIAIGDPAIGALLKVIEESSDEFTLVEAASTVFVIKRTVWKQFLEEQKGKMSQEGLAKLNRYAVIFQ
jgi:hypothetical protein